MTHKLDAFDTIFVSFLSENADNLVEAKILAGDVKTVVSALNIVPRHHMHDAAQLFTNAMRQWSENSLQFLAGHPLHELDAVSNLKFVGVSPVTGMGIIEADVKLNFFDLIGELSELVGHEFQQHGIASKHAVSDAFASATTKKMSAPEAQASAGTHKFTASSSSSAVSFIANIRRLAAGVLEQRAKYFGPKVVGSIIRNQADKKISMWRPMKAISSVVDDDMMMLSLVVECVPRKSMPK